MRILKIGLLPLLAVSLSAPVHANISSVCDMWGTARLRPVERQFTLKELAEFVKKDEFASVRNCYGTESLKTEITMSPFEMDPFNGTMHIMGTQSGSSAHQKVTINGQSFEMKTNGDQSQVLGHDNKWHDVIPALKGVEPILRKLERFGPSPAVAQEAKEYSDERLAPMSDVFLLNGVATMASSFGLLFGLQYAPLADSEGLRENVGGWDTTVWKINNEKAEAYAASRGRPLDTSGSHIRYWVTTTGLVVKVDAYLTSKVTQEEKPIVFKYQVSK